MVKIYKRGEEFQIVTEAANGVWGHWLFFYIGKYLKKKIKMIPYFYLWINGPETKLIRTYKSGDAKKVAQYIVKLLEKGETDANKLS